MASRNVKMNTFFQQKPKPFIDLLSKLYIVAGCLLGLNRVPVILNEAKYIITSLVVVHSILFSTGIYYISYIFGNYSYIIPVMSLTEFTFGITFSFITWKRMERYYNELNKFDVEIGCRPKVTVLSIRNFILMVVTSVLFIIFFWVTFIWILSPSDIPYSLEAIPLCVLHCLELFYCGHLLSLLVPRLRLINYFVETRLSNRKSATCPNVEKLRSSKCKNVENIDMKNLMDLYYIIIKAYDFLVEAIKWQLLVVLISTFVSTLMFCYYLAAALIHNKLSMMFIAAQLDLMVMEIVPLFSPCVFGDRVHGEVRRLREHLATRLYENKLDKSGRSAARALLALTEARDLSFSLLRMLQVDISLPFKFIGLLVTYLIIMLQFEKVLIPQTTSTPPAEEKRVIEN